MANEHSIRVSARGEFGQLENGLKNLQRDLKSVLGEIDKGARRGGLFDDTQLRALDVYRARFKSTMADVEREMQKQNDTIDQLWRRRQNSAKDEQKAIDDEIKRREKALDVLRRQIRAVDELSNKRNKEAESYERYQAPESSSGGGGSSSGVLFGGAMAKALGLGKFMVGLAGVTGIASMAQQAYGLAYQSQVTPMNLSQRIRGYGYQGSAKEMWDTIGGIGRNNSMGYTSQESWQFQDIYSRQAGALGQRGLEHALMFGRGYGLDVGESAGVLGANRQLGGTSSSQEFANMIAQAVGTSGMTPRILEVMEASNGLLAQMNTSLKDGGTKQILAYQTTLDKLGNANGMMRLTGQQGANVIGGLGGIFNPSQNNNWKWMGIQALQQYNPGKYGKMGLYDLETNFEDGLENTDNVAAMAQYLRGKSGGNNNTFKRMMQRWLQDGGYNATKQQVNDLDKVTNGFTAFDSNKMQSVMGSLAGGDGTAKYQERMGQLGQDILDTDARFEKTLENFGQPLLATVQGIKESVTSIFEDIQNDNATGILGDIKKFMDDNLTTAIIGAGIVAALASAGIISKGAGILKGGRSGAPPVVPGGGGVVDTLVKGAKIVTGISALQSAIEASSTKGKENAKRMAKKAGLNPNSITWADRWTAGMIRDVTFGKVSEQDVYNAESKKGMLDMAKKGKAATDKLFPSAPYSKEQAEAYKNLNSGKTADGKKWRHLSWENYANPANWGKSTSNPKEKSMWQDIFGGQSVVTSKQQKAYDDLSKLGSSGLINLSSLTDVGKQKLQEMADQGLISIKQGQTVQSTALSGFTEEGKAKLQMLADTGQITLSGFKADGTANISALTINGQKWLEKLKADGLIDIGKFKETSTLQITNLSKEGAKQLTTLEKNGSVSMSSMDTTTTDKLEKVRKTTSDKLGDIKSEHVTWSDKLIGKDGIFTKMADKTIDIFDGLAKWWKDHMPSWLGGGDSSVGNSPFLSGGGKALDSRVLSYKDQLAKAGAKYGISDVNMLMAIMNQESHGAGNDPMQSGGSNPTDSINKGVSYFAKVLKKAKGDTALALQAYNMGEGYIDFANAHGGNSAQVAAMFSAQQKRQSGYNVYGDSDYVNHVMQYYPSGAAMGAGGIWNDWQNHITSHFGSMEGFRSSPHRGMDIAAKQGTAVTALQGGKISFINMDDGGKYDKDGKANTRAGGTELGVQMANGMTYFFAHLSAINPEILKAFESGKSINVNAGDWLANSGGTPGIAGSGNDTTGAHLHTGYMDANGNLRDPESWLRSLSSSGAGDSDIGTMSGSTVKKIEVDVNLSGDGVSQLNGATQSQLQKLIQQAIQTYEAQRLLLNPSM